ncbi:MAG: hypothetical protein JWL96_1513 [Sphingomonas bacterium]|nr:hypothetical protein [Sphingomonas bacterium]
MERAHSHSYYHPGEGRGPVGKVAEKAASLRYYNLSNWAPAFAGVELILQ